MEKEQDGGAQVGKLKVSWATRLLTNPAYGVVTGVATLVSVPLSIYLYFSALAIPKITYFVHPVRTAIVSSKLATDLKVTYADKPIRGDLSAAQITVWNAGKMPVQASDVLQPFRLIVKDASIIDVKVTTVSRPLIAFATESSSFGAGSVPLHWRVLERNDGAMLQVIYQGSLGSEIAVEGATVGQPVVEKFALAVGRGTSFREEVRNRFFIALLSPFVVTGYFFLIRQQIQKHVAETGRTTMPIVDRLLLGVYAVAAILMLYLAFSLVYAQTINGPPFGY